MRLAGERSAQNPLDAGTQTGARSTGSRASLTLDRAV
jgi:hypothetical protein